MEAMGHSCPLMLRAMIPIAVNGAFGQRRQPRFSFNTGGLLYATDVELELVIVQ